MASGYRKWLRTFARYCVISKLDRRLDKLPETPQFDRVKMHQIHALQTRYSNYLKASPPQIQIYLMRWMLEELRVSLFAQMLGTPIRFQAYRTGFKYALQPK